MNAIVLRFFAGSSFWALGLLLPSHSLFDVDLVGPELVCPELALLPFNPIRYALDGIWRVRPEDLEKPLAVFEGTLEAKLLAWE